jgi:serine protease Do
VNIQQVTDEIARSLGLRNGTRGALVARAQEGGPAAAGGIQAGDVILRFNGTEVREMRTLPRIVADTPVGNQVPVVVWREGASRPCRSPWPSCPASSSRRRCSRTSRHRGRSSSSSRASGCASARSRRKRGSGSACARTAAAWW